MNSTSQKHPEKTSNLGYSDMALNNHRELDRLVRYHDGAMLGEGLEKGRRTAISSSSRSAFQQLYDQILLLNLVLP